MTSLRSRFMNECWFGVAPPVVHSHPWAHAAGSHGILLVGCPGDQRVIWFLVSDSKLVRAKAKKRFGAKLLTRIDNVSVGHINPWAPNVRTPLAPCNDLVPRRGGCLQCGPKRAVKEHPSSTERVLRSTKVHLRR